MPPRLSAQQVLRLLNREQQELLPYTRVFDLGSSFNVSVSEAGIDEFADRWPASGLRGLRGVTFQFDKRGGLVDIFYNNGNAERWEGYALTSLSEDAQAIGEARLGYAGRPAPPPRQPRTRRS